MDTTGHDSLPFSDLEQRMRDDAETPGNSELIPDETSFSGATYYV